MTSSQIKSIEEGVKLVPEYQRALTERHQTGKIFFRIDFKEVETLVAALTAAGEMVGEGWRDDPATDERWNEGVDFAQLQLCKVLKVDPKSISWDAATETLDGDVQSVIGKILDKGLGNDDWRSPAPSPDEVERVARALYRLEHGIDRPNWEEHWPNKDYDRGDKIKAYHRARAALAAIGRT